ncbi:alginate regulatory protein [Paenibacillus baekrokdamisoli]|uniref:Alginate regulatory protein n=1 Tax=Paenibacillus baekrokdamisoli TaxID=1712516 RepID=A0A3G9JBQ4_9BACL|nr:MBOAT family O-acyltransferase [Paenibacillus baekrokdamisoli]MBB3073003.1 alginate O-acetyltransferase complex protein AlgI [Paenibacillus baekrokdamisoli]BBH23331.1 alginate regulatory protein [Paenibacillus baekrokdamisoli]
MVFSSLFFLYLFLPILLIAYFAFRNTSYRNWILILFSFAFYAWGEPVWIILLILASIIGYLFALGIEKYRGTWLAKAQFIVAIAINIGILGFFKYSGFLVDTIHSLLPIQLPHPEVTLPIGISFFTFEIICYLTDVYKGRIAAPRSPKKLLLYVSFFPHLVAGPIIRYTDIEHQIENPTVTMSGFSEGITRFMIGLGKKVIIANLLGESVGNLLGPSAGTPSMMGTWFGVVLFALQIYFDFSGYSDMAIGLGKMFGFNLRENFNYPYISKSAGEFWRRWNMSLGGFFRDYVYIPLGGNQRFYLRNLFVVWFLTGFWHGASWNFIIWGLYFGLLIYLERLFLGKWLDKLPTFVAYLYSTLAMLIGWVWFYFTDLSAAISAFKSMFHLSGGAFITTEVELYFKENLLLFIIAIIASTPLFKWSFNRIFASNEKLKQNIATFAVPIINLIILIVATILLIGSTYNPFLYYRF